MKANSISEWPPRLGERFPPVLRQQVIERSSKRVAAAKSILIGFTFLSSLVIGSTVVYGALRVHQPSTNKTVTYITKQGDDLWTIAEHFDPDANTQEVISEIEQMNHLSDNDYLQVDKTLTIPMEVQR